MVIAAPRSGTGWAANWLTTDMSLCYHGLSARAPMERWQTLESDRMLGTAETALWWAAEMLNLYPARKVILHRDPAEICASLQMPELLERIEHMQTSLCDIDGMHVRWDQMFDDPAPIYEHLLQRPFDGERHAELVRLQVTCMPKRVTFDPDAVRQMQLEMACS